MADLRFESRIPATQQQLFDFHMDFSNVRIVTPPLFATRFVSVPETMEAGSRIVVEVAGPVGWMPWEIRVEQVEPHRLLVDAQDGRGPFRTWRHEHQFITEQSTSLLIDRITYTLPFGILGRIADLLVMQWVQRLVFLYRHRKTIEYFAHR
ncbi:MAG: SRPBCC family protein [Bacteroidetes bacterium]|nr:SRPBCC family protein [Bacteroidota bacterium]